MNIKFPEATAEAACECPEHDAECSGEALAPVYRNRKDDGKLCYEWWCDDCREAAEELPEDDDPESYQEAAHCPSIPGLD